MTRPGSSYGALHGALFLAALIAVRIGLSQFRWPWHFLLPLAIYYGVVSVCAPLRRTVPRLAVGIVTGLPLAVATAFGLVTVLALVLFHQFAHPDVADLAAALPSSQFGSLLVGSIIFSVINATLEELIFRGLLWEFVAAEWNHYVALAATTVLFGLGHAHGYPPGLLGAVLAGFFGLGLGLLRLWTDGLGLAIAVHICADATIFRLLTLA